MIKNTKKLFGLLASGCLLTSLSSVMFSVSCTKQKENITKINLYPESTTIRPNESIIIRAVVEPSFRRTNDLKWELIDCPYDEITINDEGVLSATSALSVTDLSKITVKASHNASVFATCEISILPLPTYDFQGFDKSEIRYIDRAGHICSQKIKPTGPFTYTTTQNIDIFEMEQEIPEPFTSLIDFTPIISGSSLPYMRFELENGEYAKHAITWDFLYDDGSWTNEIPNFTVSDPSILFDTINVYFACDPRVCFTIHFNVWQDPGSQVTDVKVSYLPTESSDPHIIDYESESVYRCSLYCPATSSVGTFSQTLSTIYVYRPKYEFLGLTFEVKPSVILDPSIAKMLTTSPALGSTFTPQMREREYDHLRYYEFDLSYEFKLDGREHTAEFWKYDTLPLFSIMINDDDGETSYLACQIDFYLEWI